MFQIGVNMKAMLVLVLCAALFACVGCDWGVVANMAYAVGDVAAAQIDYGCWDCGNGYDDGYGGGGYGFGGGYGGDYGDYGY
jgi:hypothetical protein